jgi:hypothetical protein
MPRKPVQGESVMPSGLVPALADVEAVRLLKFRGLPAPDRTLVAIEGETNIPFAIARVFTITARRADLIGGQHAHLLCQQMLVCLSGACVVTCLGDPAQGERRFELSGADTGLYIPASIWAQQLYLTQSTVLMVLCDRHFEADDYIRDFEQFKRYRAGH